MLLRSTAKSRRPAATQSLRRNNRFSFLDHPRKMLTDRDALEDRGLVSPAGEQCTGVLYRHDYAADIEKEAEALGTLLVYDIAQRQLRRAPSTASLVARQLR